MPKNWGTKRIDAEEASGYGLERIFICISVRAQFAIAVDTQGSFMLDFESTPVGTTFTAGPVNITKEKIIAFAREYDPLPFHMDEEFAAGHRHKGLIAPGVMSFMAVWADFIGRNLWGENMLGGRSTKIEWLKPVYAGDSIRGELQLTAKRRRNPYNGLIVIESQYYNQQNALVMTNITEMVIAGKEPLSGN